MRLISGIAARLIRLLSASAVRIALSATITTPQPAIAFHAANITRQQLAPLVRAAAQATASDNTTESGDTPPPSGLGGPGPGWG